MGRGEHWTFLRTSGAVKPSVFAWIFIFLFSYIYFSIDKSGTAGETVQGRVIQFGGLVQTVALTVDTKKDICLPKGGTIIKVNITH